VFLIFFGERGIAMADKDYEPPSSEGLTGDELDDVAGGAGSPKAQGGNCEIGNLPPPGGWCGGGKQADAGCRMGDHGQ
jgi:hypothetical protein